MRRYRIIRGLTQQQLADALKTDKAYIARLERGKIKEPGLDQQLKFTRALRVPLRFIADPRYYAEETRSYTAEDVENAIMRLDGLDDARKLAIIELVRPLIRQTT